MTSQQCCRPHNSLPEIYRRARFCCFFYLSLTPEREREKPTTNSLRVSNFQSQLLCSVFGLMHALKWTTPPSSHYRVATTCPHIFTIVVNQLSLRMSEIAFHVHLNSSHSIRLLWFNRMRINPISFFCRFTVCLLKYTKILANRRISILQKTHTHTQSLTVSELNRLYLYVFLVSFAMLQCFTLHSLSVFLSIQPSRFYGVIFPPQWH